MLERQLRRRVETGGGRHVIESFAERDDIVRHAVTLLVDDKGVLQFRVGRRHTDRAPVRMAHLRLDAADVEHEPPSDIDAVGPERERDGDFVCRDEFAGSEQRDTVTESIFDEQLMHIRERRLRSPAPSRIR